MSMTATTPESPHDTTVKKSVTLRRSVAEEIEARTGSRGFSAFMDTAAEHWLALLKAGEIIDDFETRNPPLTTEELEKARQAWHGR